MTQTGALNNLSGLLFVDCHLSRTVGRVLAGVDAASRTSVNIFPPFPVST